jgi:hypothetical protein
MLTTSFLTAQTVNVTFRVNSSTVPDTMTASSVFQVRGDTSPLTWGGDTGGDLVNVGGDYWEVTLPFTANTSVNYKLFANAAGNASGNGWESNLSTGSTNRELTVGIADTTLPLQFFNTTTGNDQFFLPYAATDSFDVYFRVNVHKLVQDVAFDPLTQVMMVKGGTWPGSWGDLTWNTATPSKILAPETGSDNGGQFTYPFEHFWSGRVRIPNDSVTVGDTINYKFIIADAIDPTTGISWEGTPDRPLVIPANHADTTVYWSFWENEPPISVIGNDTVMVKFRADMTRAILENGFSIGDTLLVRWGYNGSSDPSVDTLDNVFLTNKYEKTVEATNVEFGSALQYQYYVVLNGNEEREVYFDFNDPVIGSQEKRKIALPLSPPSVVVTRDTIAGDIDPHRMPRFRDTSPIGRDVTVTWTVDMRPPYYQVLEGDTLQNIQGNPPEGWIYPGQQDSIFVWGVWMNGPAVGGWSNPAGNDWNADLRANLNKKLYDDGTNGDLVAGDSIYSRQVLYSPDSSDIIGQIYKFGIYGGDNEGGDAGYGNNHVANIDDSGPTFTIHSEFGSINQIFYWVWFLGYDPTGVIEKDGIVLHKPTLNANYPNPFNPLTTMTFELPEKMDASLIIYDVLGRKVKELLNGPQNKGVHKVLWNGTDNKGRFLSSGIYFYQLKTANFEKTMKMMLLK